MKVKITIIAQIYGRPDSDMTMIVDEKIRELNFVDAIESVTLKPVKRGPK